MFGAMRYSIKTSLHSPAFPGVLLIFVTFVALAVANSPFGEIYQNLVRSKISLIVVNDALMALFFLLMGLEVKRELLVGELASKERFLQPVFAAIGGMAIPALLYIAVNAGYADSLRGWAIPCATDIAFALGILALVGSNVPPAIKIMLTAIAILDDLGAILIIAFFYTGGLDMDYACAAITAVIGLIALNKMKERHVASYLFCGAVLWYAFLKMGIHPTLAGVITGFAVPLKMQHKKKTLNPAGNLEHVIHPWVIYGVIPIFAFLNAGVSFTGMTFDALLQPLPLGIFIGLLVGKPIGILGGLFIGHITGIAKKADTTRWKDYAGIAVLCGIGFTMALFIGDLAYFDENQMAGVKIGVLSASLLSAAIGYAVCRWAFKRTHK